MRKLSQGRSGPDRANLRPRRICGRRSGASITASKVCRGESARCNGWSACTLQSARQRSPLCSQWRSGHEQRIGGACREVRGKVRRSAVNSAAPPIPIASWLGSAGPTTCCSWLRPGGRHDPKTWMPACAGMTGRVCGDGSASVANSAAAPAHIVMVALGATIHVLCCLLLQPGGRHDPKMWMPRPSRPSRGMTALFEFAAAFTPDSSLVSPPSLSSESGLVRV